MRELKNSELTDVSGGASQYYSDPWVLSGETKDNNYAIDIAIGGAVGTVACGGPTSPYAAGCAAVGGVVGDMVGDVVEAADEYFNDPRYVGGSDGAPITDPVTGEIIMINVILPNAGPGNGYTDGGQLGNGSFNGHGGIFGQ